MKAFFTDPKKMGIAGLAACLVGAVASTVADIVSTVRRDKRHKKLYATLQLKAEQLGSVADIEEIEEKEDEE